MVESSSSSSSSFPRSSAPSIAMGRRQAKRNTPASQASSPSKRQILASVLLLVALLATLATPVAALGVVAFDYGTDSLKTALVKPGMAPDVVLTRDSKRKLPSVVAFKGSDRLFGTDAMNLATRYPGDTFPDAKLLLGRAADENDLQTRQRYSTILNSTLVPTDRNTIAVQRETDYTKTKSGADVHTAEELVAMQLSHARALAEEIADEKVRITYPGSIGTFGGLDSVVVVPSFWTATERQAIFDAANLAGFKPRLVSDAAAAATSYALTRTFDTPELHLLYDSGHSSTRASLVRFSTKSFPTEDLFGTSLKEHTYVEVLSTGWSRGAGGLAFDEIVREILVGKFDAKHAGQNVRKNARAMARLLAAASKAKQVLSANQDARVNIEGLINDVDFSTSVSREEFEEAVSAEGLDKQFETPIEDALKRGGHKLADLNSVILIGGNSRVPLVQKALATAGVSSSLIAQNLNADEAIALGAGFYGASFNVQLRMKPVKVADVNAFPLILREADGKEETLWNGSPETFEKDVTAPRIYSGVVDDFTFETVYGPKASTDGLLDTFPSQLYRFEVQDVNKTLHSLKTAGDISKVDTIVNITIASSPLGIPSVTSAWLTVKPKKDNKGVVGALRSFFGGSASPASNTTDTNSTDANSTAAAEEEADLLSDKHVKLTVETIPLGNVQLLSSSASSSSKDKLYQMDFAARRKIQTEEIRNKLESFVYRMRELADGSSNSAFEQSSTAAERKKIAEGAAAASEYLSSDKIETAPMEDIRRYLADLEKLVKPIEARMEESKGRTGSKTRLLKVFSDVEEFLAGANKDLEEAVKSGTSSRFARTDLDSLQSDLKKDSDWFTKADKEQAKKKQEDEPAWRLEEAEKRGKKLSDKMVKLKKRRIPKTRPSAAGKDKKAKESASAADKEKDEDKDKTAKKEEAKVKVDEEVPVPPVKVNVETEDTTPEAEPEATPEAEPAVPKHEEL